MAKDPRGVGGQPGAPRSQAPLLSGAIQAPGVQVKTVLDLAMNFLGMPYKWGGASPETSFDCSGLIQYAYGQNGIKLPRVSKDQAKQGVAVNPRDAQPGDLVAFDNNPNRPGVDHIGIYLGGGRLLQAPRTGRNIEVTSVDLSKAVTIRRVLPPEAFSGLGSSGARTSSGAPQYVYEAPKSKDATPPTRITPQSGGGDPGNNPGGGRMSAGNVYSGGTITSPTLGGPLPANATPEQITAEVARSYGYLSAFMTDPELGPILRKAAIEDWDEATLMGALSKTNFWKTNSATARQWDALNKTDHATAKAQVNARTADIQARAAKAGLTLSGLRAHDMAVNSLKFGWNEQQLTNALMAEGKLDLSGNTPNDALSIRGTLRQRANQYLVPMADAALDKWTGDVVSGKVSQEAFDAYLREQAKSMFPAMSAAIDSGVTVAQYVDPYKQYAAQILEVAPESINFNDPKWGRALFQTDPKTGQRTSMSLSQWQETLRKDPTYGYQKTGQAKDQAARLTESILQTFGAVAT